MVSCDRISKHCQDVCVLNGFKLGQLLLDGLEEWRVVDVGGCLAPLEMDRLIDLQRVPPVSPLAQLAVCVNVQLRLDYRVLEKLDLLPRGPKLPQVDVFSVSIFSDWLSLEVDVDSPCNSECYHQWRRGEEVCLGHRVHSPFEVSVSRQD
jgi:hypothetical protein